MANATGNGRGTWGGAPLLAAAATLAGAGYLADRASWRAGVTATPDVLVHVRRGDVSTLTDPPRGPDGWVDLGHEPPAEVRLVSRERFPVTVNGLVPRKLADMLARRAAGQGNLLRRQLGDDLVGTPYMVAVEARLDPAAWDGRQWDAADGLPALLGAELAEKVAKAVGDRDLLLRIGATLAKEPRREAPASMAAGLECPLMQQVLTESLPGRPDGLALRSAPWTEKPLPPPILAVRETVAEIRFRRDWSKAWDVAGFRETWLLAGFGLFALWCSRIRG